MLRLTYSSHTELLLQRLVADLAELRRAQSPLEPVHLVVPNRNVATWIRFGLARETGIAANLEMHLLRRFASTLLVGDSPGVALLDAAALRAGLLELFLDEAFLADPALAPVRAYLGAGGDSADARDLRRVQLADKLGRLFEEYGYSREEWLEAWPERPVLGALPLHAETERWQRKLWLALAGPRGLLTRGAHGTRHLRPAELLQGRAFDARRLPARLHVFGVSYVARVFQQLLARLAQRTDLRMYALNPCREFWDDVRTPGELHKAQVQRGPREDDAFDLLDASENRALRLWGRPGRENVRLLNELSDCDFDAAFPEEPEGGSLLARVQRDILARAPEPEAPLGVAADESIRFLACPGARREAEVVAEEIWKLILDDEARPAGAPPLRFNDIAVIVAGADRDATFTHLRAAFEACHGIPHNVVDLQLAQSSRVAEAVAQVLALPLAPLTRPSLLGLLTHPRVHGRFPEIDPAQWVRWCEALPILHGADHGDHADTYITGDVWSWDQGLRRLALGAFFTGEASGEERTIAVGEHTYLPEELAGDQRLAAGQLARLARSLIADARFAARAELTLAEWARFMAAMVESCLEPASDADERELERCLQLIRALGEVALGEKTVSYRLAHELVALELAGQGGARGQHLADGVVVSSSQPMRALPFRAIFMVGLGEGSFPAVDRPDPLDLRNARLQPGDVTERERDRYLFLETLLCARDRLYLSWLDREQATGEPLQPASVVHELRDILEKTLVGPKGIRFEKPSLRRHEDTAPIRSEESRREAEAAALGQGLRAALGVEVLPPPAAWKDKLPDDVRARLGFAAAPAEPEANAAPLRLSLSALRGFLACPLQAYARYGLGLEDAEAEPDALDQQDEHFAFDRAREAVLLRDVFLRARRGEGSLEALHAEALARLANAGRAPLGIFGGVAAREQTASLQAWRGLLDEEPWRQLALRTHTIGGGQEHERADVSHPAIRIQLASGRRVELAGRVAAVDAERATVVQLRWSRGGKPTRPQQHKDALGAWIELLALRARGLAEGEARLVTTYAGPAPLLAPLTIAPGSAQEAQAQLTAIVEELLGGGHAHLLPIEAVLTSAEKRTSISFEVEKLLETPGSSFSSRYGPIGDLSPYAPLPEAEAQARVARRLGAFLRHLGEGSR